jgi:hypothetical protein
MMRPAPAVFTCAALVSGCSPGGPDPTIVPAGLWGGQHVALEVGAADARLELDCAHGTIDEPLRLDGDGRFDAAGVFVPEHGGPVRPDEPPDRRPARYRGSIDGGRMRLEIALVDTGPPVGRYQLALGRTPRVFKCL